MTLMEMSVAGGVMIAAVAVIRAVAMDRLPKKTFLALWAVALLRLWVPVALPSPASLYNAVPQVEMSGVHRFAPALPTPGGGVSVVGGSSLSLTDLLPLVWLLGALALAGFFLVSWARCRLVFRESLPVEDPFARSWLEAHPLRRKVALRQTDRVSSPLTYGLLRPVVLLPAAMNWADTDRVGYVLTHELYHVRRLDGLWKLLLTGALCLHWFNPLVWCMYVLANRDLELTCDESVVRSYGETVKSAYALTLIGMEEKRSMLTPFCNSFSKNAIEERVRAIMKQKQVTIAAIAGAVILVAAVSVFFATSAPKNEEPPAPAGATASGRVQTSSALDHMVSAVETGKAVTQNLDWNEEYGLKLDPETGHYYTKKQYNQVAALKTEGYAGQSIAEFNRSVNKTFNDYEGGYEGSLSESWEVLWQELPTDDPLAPFVYYTLRASMGEYNAKLSAVYGGKKAEYSFDARAKRTETADVFGEAVEVGEAEISYTIRYDILDQDNLTVGERDQFLADITAGMQAYLDKLDLKSVQRDADGDVDESAMTKAVQAELDRLGKAGTTGHISYTGGVIDGCYAYLAWD